MGDNQFIEPYVAEVERQGFLSLMGKRIIGVSEQDLVVKVNGEDVELTSRQPHTHLEDEDLYEEVPEHMQLTTVVIPIKVAQNFFDTYGTKCYYEDGKIKKMKKVKAKVNKTSILNDEMDQVTYTIETNEPMEFHIGHKIVSDGGFYLFYKEPVNGKIEFTLSSEVVGITRINATGQTVYAEEVSFEVKVGDKI